MNGSWFDISKWINLIIGKLLKPIARNPPQTIVQAPLIKPPPVQPAPAPVPETRLEFSPKKDFPKPVLWKYYSDKSKDIWYARNHQDYIQPDNELVAYFAERIEFDVTWWQGHLIIVYKGTDRPVNFIYRIDDGRLCRESGQNDQECYELQDFWMNPDYYIWNELEGDCEDYSILIGSVCERLDIPYMIVGGYVQYAGGIKDWWVEFIYKEYVYIGQVNMNGGMPNLLNNIRVEFKPLIMFNKRTSMAEYKEWYKT
ncbi:MAG: hypothetical protein V1854_03685 [Methanobacteriota archaeon]